MSEKFTKEKVTDIIIEWAEEKAQQGVIVFDKGFCGGNTVRYKTSKMTSFIS